MQQNKSHWGKAIASFALVLFSMPLGHAFMITIERYLNPHAQTLAGFFLGLTGLMLVTTGVFVKNNTRQTICGLIGGLLFWTGWIEFMLKYYAGRYGTQPDIDPVSGEVISRAEYLTMPGTFGFWSMCALLYILTSRTGCYAVNKTARLILRMDTDVIHPRPVTTHQSLSIFIKLILSLWGAYLLLMFCYDPLLFGDHHPFTFFVGFICFIGSILLFYSQSRIAQWGENIQRAISTVIIFWTPVEILGRINLLQEIWIQPHEHKTAITVTAILFTSLIIYFILVEKKKGKEQER